MRHAGLQLVCLLSLAFMFSTAGLAAQDALELPAGALTADQINSLVSGKTAAAKSVDGKKQAMVVFFQDDGKVRLVKNGRLTKGKWKVREDGRLCIDLKGKSQDCRAIAKDGGNYRQYAIKLDGNHRHELTYVDFKNGNQLAKMSDSPILPIGTLTKKEVVELFSGQTVESVTVKKSRVSLTYYDPSGAVEQLRKGVTRTGTWRVKRNGRICLTMEGFGEKCRIIVKDKNGYAKYIVKKNGHHKKSVTYREFVSGRHLN